MDAGELPAALRDFEVATDGALSRHVCKVESRVNFGFRFQTGYVAEISMKRYFGRGHGLGIGGEAALPIPGARPGALQSRLVEEPGRLIRDAGTTRDWCTMLKLHAPVPLEK